jgi:hypothetical protein
MSFWRIAILVLFFLVICQGMLMFIVNFGLVGFVALALIFFVIGSFILIYKYEVGNANSVK